MHFTAEISLGQIIVSPFLAGILFWLWKISSRMDNFMVEHEMLMGDLAAREGKKVSDYATRRARRW